MDVLATTGLCFWTTDQDPRSTRFLLERDNDLVFWCGEEGEDFECVPWCQSVGCAELLLHLDTSFDGTQKQCIRIRPPPTESATLRVCDVLTAVYLFYQQEVQEVPGINDIDVRPDTKLVDYVGHPYFEGIYPNDDTFTIQLGS